MFESSTIAKLLFSPILITSEPGVVDVCTIPLFWLLIFVVMDKWQFKFESVSAIIALTGCAIMYPSVALLGGILINHYASRGLVEKKNFIGLFLIEIVNATCAALGCISLMALDMAVNAATSWCGFPAEYVYVGTLIICYVMSLKEKLKQASQTAERFENMSQKLAAIASRKHQLYQDAVVTKLPELESGLRQMAQLSRNRRLRKFAQHNIDRGLIMPSRTRSRKV